MILRGNGCWNFMKSIFSVTLVYGNDFEGINRLNIVDSLLVINNDKHVFV